MSPRARQTPCFRVLCMLDAHARLVGHDIKGRVATPSPLPCLGLVATPNPGRDPMDARPCHDIKSRVATPLQPIVGLPNCDTGSQVVTLELPIMLRHQSANPGYDTKKCVATPICLAMLHAHQERVTTRCCMHNYSVARVALSCA